MLAECCRFLSRLPRAARLFCSRRRSSRLTLVPALQFTSLYQHQQQLVIHIHRGRLSIQDIISNKKPFLSYHQYTDQYTGYNERVDPPRPIR